MEKAKAAKCRAMYEIFAKHVEELQRALEILAGEEPTNLAIVTGRECDITIPRRIIGVNYTRRVSLPLPWLKARGLDVGDEVKLSLTPDGDLLISPIMGEKQRSSIQTTSGTARSPIEVGGVVKN